MHNQGNGVQTLEVVYWEKEGGNRHKGTVPEVESVEIVAEKAEAEEALVQTRTRVEKLAKIAEKFWRTGLLAEQPLEEQGRECHR